MAIHVDDSTITGSSSSLIDKIQEEIGHIFKITLLGPISWLLRMEVTHDKENHTLTLSQKTYTNSLLQKFNMENCKPASTPLDPSIQLNRDQCPTTPEKITEMKKFPYQELIGELIWLVSGSRPDLAFTVGSLLRFLDNPGIMYWKAGKQILQYLKGSQDYGLTYNAPNSTSGLQIYADADGILLNNRKAVSRYTFILNGAAISWSSKQQEIVSLSTTEAEYIALTYTAKEAIWFHNFLSELINPIAFPLNIYNDNQSAISLAHAELSQFHARTKHIDI